jgi:hypothetical protein
MVHRYLIGVLLLAVIPIVAVSDEQKKPPSLEEDLDALQGEWVQIKPEGQAKITLEFGHKEDKKEIKQYLQVSMNATKGELGGSSWGSIGLHEKDGKRSFSYNPGKHVVYKLQEGKLILDGEYDSRFLECKLTGEWKKVEKKE